MSFFVFSFNSQIHSSVSYTVLLNTSSILFNSVIVFFSSITPVWNFLIFSTLIEDLSLFIHCLSTLVSTFWPLLWSLYQVNCLPSFHQWLALYEFFFLFTLLHLHIFLTFSVCFCILGKTPACISPEGKSLCSRCHAGSKGAFRFDHQS